MPPRSTYRILQEGLTNAVRHAPGAAIQVSVTCGDGVRDRGRQPSPPAGAAGLAISAPAAGWPAWPSGPPLVGGTFASGPVPAGGWRLSAELPATA